MGRAFTLKLASEGYRVLAVGRTATDTYREASEMVVPIDMDLNDSSSYGKIKQFLGEDKIHSLFYFAVHEGPTGMENTHYEEFESVMRVNTASKLFITKELVANFKEGAKIVFLYSKAAQNYMLNAPIYCISRAAEYMVYKVLKEELKNCFLTVV